MSMEIKIIPSDLPMSTVLEHFPGVQRGD